MKDVMIVYYTDDHETHALFFDNLNDAEDERMNITCGLGWYAEIYVRDFIDEDEPEVGKEYKLLYA